MSIKLSFLAINFFVINASKIDKTFGNPNQWNIWEKRKTAHKYWKFKKYSKTICKQINWKKLIEAMINSHKNINVDK